MTDGQIKIRKARICDIDEIIELERECFTDEAWDEEGFLYRMSHDGFSTLVAELDGLFAGYISVSHVCDEMGIDSLAIKRDMRRKGVAGALIRFAIAQQNSPPHVYLEVRRSNAPARMLYESLGFKQQRIRKNYYTRPDEDAVVMCLDISETEI